MVSGRFWLWEMDRRTLDYFPLGLWKGTRGRSKTFHCYYLVPVCDFSSVRAFIACQGGHPRFSQLCDAVVRRLPPPSRSIAMLLSGDCPHPLPSPELPQREPLLVFFDGGGIAMIRITKARGKSLTISELTCLWLTQTLTLDPSLFFHLSRYI